jgi:hypothetical protein
VFFDLFERGRAERLSIQLALALEREIKAEADASGRAVRRRRPSMRELKSHRCTS